MRPLVLAAAADDDALAHDDPDGYTKVLPGLKAAFASYAAARTDAQRGPLATLASGL